jgi:hypothetical protein
MLTSWSPADARRRIAAGKGREGMFVDGALDLSNNQSLETLPARLSATAINLSFCTRLKALPTGLRCRELRLRGTKLEWIPPDLEVDDRIDARDCRRLRRLPPVAVEELILRDCTALSELPEGLKVRTLDISGCTGIEEVPASIAPRLRHLRAANCTRLVLLPENLANLDDLDVSGCLNLESLPDGMRIRSAIEVAGSGLRGLPWSLRSARVLWRGVPVPDHVAFVPECIFAAEILDEPNVELRRIMIERLGLERFVRDCRAQVIDQDQDAGGQRQLLRIHFDSDEDLYCVAVCCPSTGHRYVLRVPPTMRTCSQAIAWTAGFANPDDYRPSVET